ncbi:hypothetical protein DBZ45_10880 [Arthrobacter globiformis]|uniref:Uncharacterized protein n=1 Tax=Arthrobacter globiformis TaxID=1665 RepID=A0A328HF97_ARTGO|nr:hypothetical protein DBZ45_10880 [Arthrobacter globiformis]
MVEVMADPARSSPQPGTVGVGVVDGGYGDESLAEDIRHEVQDWLRRAGVTSSSVVIPGTGSAIGPFMESVAQNVWASLLILAASKAFVFFKGIRDVHHRRRLNRTQRFCLIQLWDCRGDSRNAIELLHLLPDIHAHLSQEFPNRAYSFFLMSAMNEPRIERLHIKLEDYDDLRLTIWQASKMLCRMSGTPFAFMHLEDGPYGSRRISLSAV